MPTLEIGTPVRLKPNINAARRKLFGTPDDTADFSLAMGKILQIESFDSNDRTPPYEELYRLMGSDIVYYGQTVPITECIVPKSAIDVIPQP